MIPAEFTGGWVRASMSLDGAEPFEDTVVWWLQSTSKHVDLRLPLVEGEVISFAGTTTWEAPSLTWVPDLELVPNEFPDTGVVSWDGDDLLEAGTFIVDGSEVGYVERWQRLPDTSGPLQALSRPGGRLVRTGSLALTVLDERDSGGVFNVIAWRLAEGAWTADHCWPPDASAPPPPSPAVELEAGASIVLDDGATWTVDETLKLAVAHG